MSSDPSARGRRWILAAYVTAGLLTLAFQLWVRHGQCNVNQDCWLSFTKAVLWSVIWPASWLVYLPGIL